MILKHIHAYQEESGTLHSSSNSASSGDMFNFYHDVTGRDWHVMCTFADILPLFLKLVFLSLHTSLQQNRKRQTRSSDIYSHHWNGLPKEQ